MDGAGRGNYDNYDKSGEWRWRKVDGASGGGRGNWNITHVMAIGSCF